MRNQTSRNIEIEKSDETDYRNDNADSATAPTNTETFSACSGASNRPNSVDDSRPQCSHPFAMPSYSALASEMYPAASNFSPAPHRYMVPEYLTAKSNIVGADRLERTDYYNNYFPDRLVQLNGGNLAYAQYSSNYFDRPPYNNLALFGLHSSASHFRPPPPPPPPNGSTRNSNLFLLPTAGLERFQNQKCQQSLKFTSAKSGSTGCLPDVTS